VSSPRARSLHLWFAAVAVVALVLVGGCSDDTTNDGDPNDTPTTSVPSDPAAGDESDDEVPDTPNAGPGGSVDERPPEQTTTTAPGE